MELRAACGHTSTGEARLRSTRLCAGCERGVATRPSDGCEHATGSIGPCETGTALFSATQLRGRERPPPHTSREPVPPQSGACNTASRGQSRQRWPHAHRRERGRNDHPRAACTGRPRPAPPAPAPSPPPVSPRPHTPASLSTHTPLLPPIPHHRAPAHSSPRRKEIP